LEKKQTDEQSKKEAKNMAYQALFLADGVVFLFQALFLADGVVFLFKKTSGFTPDEVTVIDNDKGEVFIELGRNVIKITEKIIKNLKKHKTIFLYETQREYDSDSIPIAFELRSDAMDKLEVLWKEKNNARQGKPAHRTHRAAGNNQH